MAKKTRIEDIDSEAVINSFRLDDTSIPPEARSTGGNAPSPPPKEELQTVITSPLPSQRGTGTQAQEWQAGKAGL